jgi:hypothetical protein
MQRRHRLLAPIGATAFTLGLLVSGGTAQAIPIIGDQTSVLLTSIQTLTDAGVAVSALGSAQLTQDEVGRDTAVLPITGGDFSPPSITIEHGDAGLQLSGGGTTVAADNLVIDIEALTLSGDVSVDGGDPTTGAIFNLDPCIDLIGSDAQCIDGDGSILFNGYKLTLTEEAAALAESLGLTGDLVGAQFGVAYIDVRLVPEPSTAVLIGLGLVAAAAGRRRMR